jgi:1-acyl-sn-glycerol-3-phosphate acyltransferase
MEQARLVVRITLLACWVLVLLTVLVLGQPIRLVSPRVWRSFRRMVGKFWSGYTVGIMGGSIEVRGTTPKSPYFMVANHLTYMDTFVLAAVTGCAFVAKAEVASWPVIGIISRMGDAIFVNRTLRRDTVRVNEDIARALKEDDCVTMFAESTTSRGLTVEPFKSALFECVADNTTPVCTATIMYETPQGAKPPSEYVIWWRNEEDFGFHVLRLMRNPGFKAIVSFGDETFTSDNRKELAERTHQSVISRFQPHE